MLYWYVMHEDCNIMRLAFYHENQFNRTVADCFTAFNCKPFRSRCPIIESLRHILSLTSAKSQQFCGVPISHSSFFLFFYPSEEMHNERTTFLASSNEKKKETNKSGFFLIMDWAAFKADAKHSIYFFHNSRVGLRIQQCFKSTMGKRPFDMLWKEGAETHMFA